MTAEPAISVLTSVRNGEAFLAEAIASILAQTFEDFEFVLIDNGSSDGTAEIMAAYDDPRLVVLRNRDGVTLTEALNQGLARCRGRYIARLDADDIALPERLAKQHAFLEAHGDVAALGAAWREFEANGRERACPTLPSTPEDVLGRLACDTPFVHSSLMLRAEAVADVGGYPSRYAYGQDYALYLALVGRGYRLALLPDVLVRIRVHAGQASLDPAWAVLRARESLELYTRAAELPGLGAWAKRGNRNRVAECRLQYALALWRARRRGEALAWGARGWAHAPARVLAVTGRRLFGHAS